MKSKNLLLALALPVALTACTADDFMTDQSENPTVAGRKVIGNVTFVAPEGADTRLVWDGGLKWSETDKLGAALMDELVADLSGKEGAAKYEIVNELYSNYRYDYENGAFTNKNATFVEGNYFVYAQFNAKQGREGLAYSIPAVQQAGEDGRASWYKNQMFLDHIFVSEGNSQVAVNPLPVFPLVTLKAVYDGTDENVVIKKIVVSDATGKFGNIGAVKPAEASTENYDALAGMSATVSGDGNLDDYKVTTSATLDKLFNAYKKAQEDFGTKYTVAEGKTKDDIVNPNLSDYFVADAAKASESLALEYTEGKSVAGIMVVPQQANNTHVKENLKIEIYTNKGLVTIAGTKGDMSEAFNFASAKNYVSTASELLLVKAQNDIAFDSKKNAEDESAYAMPFLSNLTAGQISRFNIKFKDNAILVPSEVTVTTTEELEEYLANWYAGKKDKIIGDDGNTVTVNAAPQADGEVEVNNTVLVFMANTAANPVLKFKGTITIPAGTNADALDKITKAGSGDLNIINQANLIWKDATKTFTAITNEGTLTVGETTGTAKIFAAGITNLGTLTVNGNVETVVNGSNVAPVNATAEITLARGIVTSLTNHAVVNVNGESVITGLTNNKTLTVNANATLTTGANSVNNGGIEVAANATWNVNGNISNKNTVTNNGVITIVNGTFTNAAANTTETPAVPAGKVINNNEVACNADGIFVNNGDMEANANSITLISQNTQTGEVVVSDGFTAVNIPADTNVGKVTYIITNDAKLANVPAAANSLRITATNVDFSKLKHTGINFVEFRSTENVTVNNTAATDNKNSFANVVFNTEGATSNVVFTMESKITVSETLKIAEKAVVFINKELEYSANVNTGFENDGSIMIVGTLNFSGIEEPTDANEKEFIGKYRFTGGDKSNISWKPKNP